MYVRFELGKVNSELFLLLPLICNSANAKCQPDIFMVASISLEPQNFLRNLFSSNLCKVISFWQSLIVCHTHPGHKV